MRRRWRAAGMWKFGNLGRCAANNNNNHNGKGIDIGNGIFIGNFTPKVPKTFQ